MVTHRQVGFHCWPSAPDSRDYLRSDHRHLFLFVVACRVTHDDRDIEFHDLQDAVRRRYGDVVHFGPKSCEAIAKELATHLSSLGMPPVWVEVWEDEENGARVDFEVPA